MTKNKQFMVSNDGTLMVYNYLLETWNDVDLEKVCTTLNKLSELSFEVIWEDFEKNHKM